MITDPQAAALCVALYAASKADTHGFDVYDAGEDDGICWAIRHEADCDVIALRGSVNLHDWLVDIFARPFSDHRFGPVHDGFFLGLDHAWNDIKPRLRPHLPSCVIGHSLGAARADILAGIMIDAGMPPARRIVFGEPKPGYQPLADFIKRVPSVSYCNSNGSAHDVVTTVPFTTGPFAYVHPVPLTFVTGPVDLADPGGPFFLHHMPLYAAALANLKST